MIANNSQSAQVLPAFATEAVELVSGKTYAAGESLEIPALRGVILVPVEMAKEITVNYEDLAPAYDPAYIVGAEQPEPEVIAEGWSGYTTWVLTSDGVLTFTPTEQKYEDGQTNLKNYWKVNGVLTLPWGEHAELITKVVIQEGIHDIGQMAFYELPNLVEVVLPDSAVEIRNYAFKNCKSLTTINLEDVDFIREGAFYGCAALENVTFYDEVVIEDWAFTKTPVMLP